MVLNHVVLLVKMDQIYKVVYFHKHCSNTQKHDAQLYKQTNLLWKKKQTNPENSFDFMATKFTILYNSISFSLVQTSILIHSKVFLSTTTMALLFLTLQLVYGF